MSIKQFTSFVSLPTVVSPFKLIIYSAHQKSGDNLSFSYYLPIQHNIKFNNSYTSSNSLI